MARDIWLILSPQLAGKLSRSSESQRIAAAAAGNPVRERPRIIRLERDIATAEKALALAEENRRGIIGSIAGVDRRQSHLPPSSRDITPEMARESLHRVEREGLEAGRVIWPSPKSR